MEILLNSLKSINSVNVDNFDKIELSNKLSLIHEYDIRNILSATEVFDAEREANEIYRIYGKIEYLSMLNGLKSTYTGFTDFFKPQVTGNYKNLLNSFDFYLVRPASDEYIQITGLTGSSSSSPDGIIISKAFNYIRKFEIIATPRDFEIYPAGFANNVYGEQAYAFNFNRDFDVSGILDGFGFPLTELFLYAQYKPTFNGHAEPEKMFAVTWSHVTKQETTFELTPTVPIFNIGDILFHNMNYIGDVIGYSKPKFYQIQEHPQTFYIETPYYDEGTHKRLRWKYNPFIPFQLRYFSNELYKENTGNTVYEIVSSIPYFATKLDDRGNYVWRNILPQGYIDPLTGIGVDYPFVNQRRYLFSNILLIITPDLNDDETRIAFEDAWYTKNLILKAVKPISNLGNIGKPCL